MPEPGGRTASRRSAPQRCEEGARITGRPGGQDVSQPTQDPSRRIGTCRRRSLGKDLWPPEASEARGRLREPTQRRRLTAPGGRR
jgi:hypothetical protein